MIKTPKQIEEERLTNERLETERANREAASRPEAAQRPLAGVAAGLPENQDFGKGDPNAARVATPQEITNRAKEEAFANAPPRTLSEGARPEYEPEPGTGPNVPNPGTIIGGPVPPPDLPPDTPSSEVGDHDAALARGQVHPSSSPGALRK